MHIIWCLMSHLFTSILRHLTIWLSFSVLCVYFSAVFVAHSQFPFWLNWESFGCSVLVYFYQSLRIIVCSLCFFIYIIFFYRRLPKRVKSFFTDGVSSPLYPTSITIILTVILHPLRVFLIMYCFYSNFTVITVILHPLRVFLIMYCFLSSLWRAFEQQTKLSLNITPPLNWGTSLSLTSGKKAGCIINRSSLRRERSDTSSYICLITHVNTF